LSQRWNQAVSGRSRSKVKTWSLGQVEPKTDRLF